jgi:hypothetical protein
MPPRAQVIALVHGADLGKFSNEFAQCSLCFATIGERHRVSDCVSQVLKLEHELARLAGNRVTAMDSNVLEKLNRRRRELHDKRMKLLEQASELDLQALELSYCAKAQRP